MKRSDLATRHVAFRKLHERGCFILPDPWDPGSARWRYTPILHQFDGR